MPQIFHRSANTLAKVSIVGILLLAGGLIGLIMIFGRSSYVTRASEFIEQPLQFSHAHHVGDDGIDCRYCHTSVETSSSIVYLQIVPLGTGAARLTLFPVCE